jgi:hypothetical protein
MCVCVYLEDSGDGLGQGMMGRQISPVLESDSERWSVPKRLCNMPAHLHTFCAGGHTCATDTLTELRRNIHHHWRNSTS